METAAHPQLGDFFAPWKVTLEKSAAFLAQQFEAAEQLNSAAFKAAWEPVKRRGDGKQPENPFVLGRSMLQALSEAAASYPAAMAQLAREANDELARTAIKYIHKSGELQVHALEKLASQAPEGWDKPFKALGQAVSSMTATQAYVVEALASCWHAVEHGAAKERKKDHPVVATAN